MSSELHSLRVAFLGRSPSFSGLRCQWPSASLRCQPIEIFSSPISSRNGDSVFFPHGLLYSRAFPDSSACTCCSLFMCVLQVKGCDGEDSTFPNPSVWQSMRLPLLVNLGHQLRKIHFGGRPTYGEIWWNPHLWPFYGHRKPFDEDQEEIKELALLLLFCDFPVYLRWLPLANTSYSRVVMLLEVSG